MWKNVYPNRAAEYLAVLTLLYAESLKHNNGHFFTKLKDFSYEVPCFIPAEVFPKPGSVQSEQEFYNKLIKPLDPGSAYSLSFLQGKVLRQKQYEVLRVAEINNFGITMTAPQLLQVLYIFFHGPGGLSELMLGCKPVPGEYFFEFYLNKNKFFIIVEALQNKDGSLEKKYHLFEHDNAVRLDGKIVHAYVDFLRKS